MSPGMVLGLLPIAGLAAGLAKAVSPRIPWIAVGLVAAAFALFSVASGGWAATCWDCDGIGTPRSEIFYVGLVYFSLLTALTLVAIWLGARFSTVAGRLMRTLAELRTAVRR